MIRLNLTATPEWLDLAPGLRLLVGPLTTALMVSARADQDPQQWSTSAQPLRGLVARQWSTRQRSLLQMPLHRSPCPKPT